MPFNIRAFFEFEGRTLDVGDINGLYTLAADFVPPPVNLVPNIAVGSSANRRGGGTLATIKAANRQWNFGVHIRGTSEAEITSGIRRLDAFIRQSTPERPVYFHYRANNDVPYEPRWGSYGADLQYEIVFGSALATLAYPTGAAGRQIMPECTVSLDVKPYAISNPQQMAFAAGTVLEDDIGTPDGISRGLKLHPGTTNKMLNPIFGHATWNNGWTAGTNLEDIENQDRQFIIHGKSSAKLEASLATLNTFTESINVGNTNTHILSVYAKRQDSAPVTSADIELTYGGAVTENYDLEGDGWYRVWGVVTGVASATTTGVIVKQGHTVYIDSIQIEERDELMTPAVHGEMLGSAWSGTAHASTTVCAAGSLLTQQDVLQRHPLEAAEGSIRIVWKADHPNTEYPIWPVNRFLFLVAQNTHYCAFVPEFDTFQFSDGINVIISSAQSWSKGDIIVFHFTWGPSGLKMYFNGTEIATGSAYTPFDPTIPRSIGIGTSGLSPINGTFMDFTTYGQLMAATEITADYTNILEQVEDGRRLAPIPWFWTVARDGLIQNCNDGTKLNYAVAGGVPGSAPALTRLKMSPDTIWSGASDLWLSLLTLNEFIDPISNIWTDHQGTVEATACGGEVELFNFSGVSGKSSGIEPILRYETVAGRDVYMLVRLRDAGASLHARLQYSLAATSYATDLKRTLPADTTQRLFVLGPLPFLSYRGVGDEYGSPAFDGAVEARWQFTRTSGDAAADLHIDFVMLITRPFALLKADFLLTTRYLLLEDRISTSRVSADDSFERFIPVVGDAIEFVPEQINILSSMMGRDTEVHEVNDDEFIYSEVTVTPRWELV